MKREEAFAFTEKCINGEPATCTAACPFHMDIKAFLKKAGRGRIGAAAQEMEKYLPFPVLISTLCPAPCERACQRSTVLGEETIAIRLLERTCAESAESRTRKAYMPEPLPQRVAVVGAGAAGLSCALHLSGKRFPVVVFDRADGWGGSLRSHPQFPVFAEEFAHKFASRDVDFRFGEEITSPDMLDAFDMILLATGKGGTDFGLLAGLDKRLGTTAQPHIFMAGEMAGFSRIDGMAHTLDVAKAMESWIQTGNPAHAAVTWEKTDCSRDLPHPGEAPSAHIVPSGTLYTKEEAAKEASRCMQCDCETCMKDCDLLRTFKKKPPRIAIDVAQDGMTRNSVSTACITRQTWSCNQCGHCAQICEENVDIGGLFALSRRDRVKSGRFPPAFHGYWMKEMETAVSEGSLLRPAPAASCVQRADAAAAGTQYLFFPGCRLGGVNPAYTIRSYEVLLSRNQKTGIWLGCCGIPALWAGEGDRFAAHIDQMREQWTQIGSPVVIYACASCRRTFARFLPEIPLVSLYELLEKEILDGNLRLPDRRGNAAGIPEAAYAVFDPCAAYGLEEVRRSVRNLAEMTGIRCTDYDSSGRCCGFGGHIQMANPAFFDEVANARSEETEAPYLTYCVNCKEVFLAHGKESRHILDLIFLPAADPAQDLVTTLEEKRKNNLSVKQTILERYWGESYAPEREPWEHLSVDVSETVQSEMERLLIPLSDIRQTIWLNEENGEGFENQNGEVVCRMVQEHITCWVRYRREGETYHLLEVYAHRMRIREEER